MYFRDTFPLVHLLVFPQDIYKCMFFTVLYCICSQPLYCSLYTSNGFHLSSFTVVKGKIKKAQWERQTEWERKREHPVSESLLKNNAVCFQLSLSAGDMSCVTPAKARNGSSQYLAGCIALSFSISLLLSLWVKNLRTCGLFSDTIHIHIDLLSGSSPTCCWQG